MGTVYRARDPNLDRLVALKTITITQGMLSKQEGLERFRREARAAARLQHPNIVTIYELGEVEGTLFIAMELLEGMDLAQAMLPRDRLTLQQKARITVDVCHGLDFGHKRGVIHRDVKPGNIRILLDGTVKLVDFGIARLEDSSMTQAGLILGTPSYISPEVLSGRPVDHRCDIWAVGVMLYELLAGRLPYHASTITGLIYRIVHEPPAPFDAGELAIPAALERVVAKGMAKDPNDRYLDMAQMALDLQAAVGLAGSADTPLLGVAREQAYQRDVLEARRMLAGSDLERALEAARRAQALDPTRSEIVRLVGEIETRLDEAPTIVPKARSKPAAAPPPGAAATRVAAAPPPATPPAPRRLPTAVLTELRARGAGVFRDLGAFGEPPATAAACISPVRDLLATSGTDGAIRLWDLQNRTRVLTLRTDMHQRSGHEAVATTLAFSPDGTLLASGHVDGAVHLWNMATAEEVPAKLRHDASVGALAFSPDSAVLASGGMDSCLKLWDVSAALAGEALRELHRQPSPVTALTYSGDGAFIVTGHANRVLRVLHARGGRLKATLRGPEAQVSLLRMAPDGTRLAAVSHDRTIRIFDLATRAQVLVIGGHKKPPTALSFFADGKHLAAVAADNAVQLWDLESRSALAALWGPAEETFTGVALFGGGDHIAVALADGRIRLWGPA